MDTRVADSPQRMIEDAKGLLSDLSVTEARLLMATAADVVVVLDREATVLDVGFADATLIAYSPADWIGRPFVDCVTEESHDKALALVSGALGGRVLVGRQVNHPADGEGKAAQAPDLAVTYRAASVNGGERFVLLGTDLRPVTELQSRLLRAQLDTDRDMRRLREVETRYRLLFRLADTPLMIVDAATLEVVDANDRAGQLFGRPARKLMDLTLPALFTRAAQADVAAEAARIAERGRAGTLEGAVGRAGDDEVVRLHLEPYRETGSNHLLARGLDGDAPTVTSREDPIRAAIRAMPDGVMVIDRGGYVIDANEAALDFVRLASLDRVIGRRVDRWIGGTGVDMQVLMSNLRERGSVRRFATIVRDELGGETAVDISAAHATAGGEPVYGLVLREALSVEPVVEGDGFGPAHFAELVGRVPLRDLVRDTADIIEKLCIEEALRQTDNNRASAADMLGLSRQSLYMKLKRYGLEEGPRD